MMCMDKDGNVYVASTHRSDGKGVESVPEIVENFGASDLVENPYLEQEKQIFMEAQVNRNLDAINAKKLEMMGRRNALNRKMNKKRVESEHEANRRNHKSLLNEAVGQQQMSGADFDQLSIVDAQYGAKHAAVMQTLGYKPQMGDLPYIKMETYSNPMELEQAKINDKAYQDLAESALVRQVEEGSMPWVKPGQSTSDGSAQKVLSAQDEELYFTSEEEAKNYNNNKTLINNSEMYFDSEDQAKSYDPATVTKAEAKKLSPVAVGLALVASYFVMKG